MLEGHAEPQQLVDLALRTLPEEPDELNAERILAHTQDAFWRYLPDSARAAIADRLEQTLRGGMAKASTTSLKSAYFSAFRRTVTTPRRCRLSRARVAEAGADRRVDVCRERLRRHGAGTGAARRARHQGHPHRAARAHHQCRPQGAVRVRHCPRCHPIRRSARSSSRALRG